MKASFRSLTAAPVKIIIDPRNLMGYTNSVIKSFENKNLEKFFYSGQKKGLQAAHLEKISDVLDLLDAADAVSDMNFPGSHLHPLRGRLKGFWSVRISGNWRIVFRFEAGDAFEIDYLDYH